MAVHTLGLEMASREEVVEKLKIALLYIHELKESRQEAAREWLKVDATRTMLIQERDELKHKVISLLNVMKVLKQYVEPDFEGGIDVTCTCKKCRLGREARGVIAKDLQLWVDYAVGNRPK